MPIVHDTSEVEGKMEDSAAAGETTAEVEEQEKEQKSLHKFQRQQGRTLGDTRTHIKSERYQPAL